MAGKRGIKKIRLGVNIDHVATLRQVRAGLVAYPDVVGAARVAAQAGADQITIHLREDRRHIQDQDLFQIARLRPAELNLEMAVREDILKLAVAAAPDIVCFVPERRQEVTTEGGLDVAKQVKKISRFVTELKRQEIRSSMFIEPSFKQVKASREAGADAVEFHTGAYALAPSKREKQRLLKELHEACGAAHDLGLHVHAGHGLDYVNTKEIAKLPHLEELNIGHSIVCRAVFVGLGQAVREMKKLLGA